MKKILLLAVTLLTVSFADAEISLPQLFQSGMVLQRGKLIPIWGKAAPGELVTVRFNKKQYATTADAHGSWRINLPKMKAGGPYTLTVGNHVLTNILVGDVWLLSGQSNIDVTIERVYPQYPQEIDSYENNDVRLFRVQNETDVHGVRDDIKPTSINWKPLNKENAWLFWISKDSLERDYPMLVKRAQFFQSDDYVKSQTQTNMQADRQWQKLLQESDAGILQNWAAPDCDDANWQSITQNDWSWRGCGSVWLRQHIIINKEHAGKPARLLLGTLFDQDITYLNGKEIGHTYYQYPPRRYDIPEGLLKEGDNVIAVRFINKYGAVHFIPEKPYMLCFGDDRCSQNPMPKDVIPLAPTWKVNVGTELPNCPSGDVSLQNIPTTLYNAVLHPLAPYAINGVVWYQGESNTGNPAPYADYLKKLMGCWRDRWQDPKMPFVIVQLANYDGRQQSGFPRPITPQTAPMNSGWAQLREAQRTAAKADPRAELAVINDLGETVDIHPLRKKEVAERVALCFDRLIYNNKVNLAPEVIAAEVQEGKIILTLDQPIQAGNLYEFEAAAADGDKVFQNVKATAEDNRITLILPEGFHPMSTVYAVRYAWKDNPATANVRSLTGLPMSSFEMKVNK